MSFRVVIPARAASTRLPRKVLAEIAGEPMIAHTVRAALGSRAERVVVAVDDPEVARAAERAGALAVATRADHACGSDRVAAAIAALEWADDAVVVNVQADEPLMPPALIDQVAAALADDAAAGIATASAPIDSPCAWRDPNIVKVVCNAAGRAHYFSRAPIPHARDADSGWPGAARRHIGIYAYRGRALRAMAAAAPAPLERLESLEQLRALDIGIVIRVVTAAALPGPGVDTAADLETVGRCLRGAAERGLAR